jgi:type III pantothenate kinase
MLLAFDIGNTKTGIGIHRGDHWEADWRITTHLDYLTDEYAMLLKSLLAGAELDFEDVSGVIMSSVVPPLTAVFQELAERYLGQRALVVGPGVETGVEIRIDNPAEAGGDRVANTAAVQKLYGGPAIVLDIGTATTFDVVSERGEYLGGAIAPGPKPWCAGRRDSPRSNCLHPGASSAAVPLPPCSRGWYSATWGL